MFFGVIRRNTLITQNSCDPEMDAVRLVLDEWLHQILESNGDQCAQIGGDRAVRGFNKLDIDCGYRGFINIR